MEFNEEKAKEIICKYNLSNSTIRVWRSRNSIPDRYKSDYVQIERVDNAARILLHRLRELMSANVLNFTVLTSVVCIDKSRFVDAVRKNTPIARNDIDNLIKEVKRQRVFILNSLPDIQSALMLKNLIDNKAIKHYVVLGKSTWSKRMMYAIQNEHILFEEDYNKIKDLYIRATILMNI